MNAPAEPNNHLIGAAVKRKEDFRFLTGVGQYTDDVVQAHQSYAVFLRSPYAHARIKRIDTAAAMVNSGATPSIPAVSRTRNGRIRLPPLSVPWRMASSRRSGGRSGPVRGPARRRTSSARSISAAFCCNFCSKEAMAGHYPKRGRTTSQRRFSSL